MRCLADIITEILKRASLHHASVSYFHPAPAKYADWDLIDPTGRVKPGHLYVRFDAGYLEVVAFLPLIPLPVTAPELEAVAS